MPPRKRQRVVSPPPPPLESPPSDDDADDELFLFIIHIFTSTIGSGATPLRWVDLFASPRDFLIHSTSEVVIPYLEFTSNEYELATTALGSRSPLVSPNILNKMLESKHLSGHFPLLTELVSSIIEELNAPSELSGVFAHWIMEHGYIHSVRISTKIQEYFTRHRVYPTEDQLRAFVMTVVNDVVGAETLAALPRYPNEDSLAVCTICHTDIKMHATVLKLPCNHVFHSEGKDCLPGEEGQEGSSILTWLAQNDKCPLCKARV